MKVYCNNCKYCCCTCGINSDQPMCKHLNNLEIYDTFQKQVKTYKLCEEVNSNNNCIFFEYSLWYKIKQFFNIKNKE